MSFDCGGSDDLVRLEFRRAKGKLDAPVWAAHIVVSLVHVTAARSEELCLPAQQTAVRRAVLAALRVAGGGRRETWRSDVGVEFVVLSARRIPAGPGAMRLR